MYSQKNHTADTAAQNLLIKSRGENQMEKKETTLIILGIVAVLAVVGLVLLFKQAMAGAAVTPRYFYDNPYANTLPPTTVYAQAQACETLAIQNKIPRIATQPATKDQVPLYGENNCFKTPAGASVEYCCVQPKPI